MCCCSVLQCVAVCCSVLQRYTFLKTRQRTRSAVARQGQILFVGVSSERFIAVAICCSVLQRSLQDKGMYISLFCMRIGLFCICKGLFCMYIGFFGLCIGLFCSEACSKACITKEPLVHKSQCAEWCLFKLWRVCRERHATYIHAKEIYTHAKETNTHIQERPKNMPNRPKTCKRDLYTCKETYIVSVMRRGR